MRAQRTGPVRVDPVRDDDGDLTLLDVRRACVRKSRRKGFHEGWTDGESRKGVEIVMLLLDATTVP